MSRNYLRQEEVETLWNQIVNLFATKSSVTTLQGYFNDSGYAKRAIADQNGLMIDENYLKLTGGQLKGSSNSPLTIKCGSTSSSINKYLSLITFWDNESTAKGGQIGFYGDTPIVRINSATDRYTIYHSGNSNKSDVSWTCNDLYANGKIGIGTGSPSEKLHVSGGTALIENGNSAHLSVGYNLGQNNANRAEISLISKNDYPCDFLLGSNSAKKWSITARDSAMNYDLRFYNYTTSSYAFALDSNGNGSFNGGLAVQGIADLSTPLISPLYVNSNKVGIGTSTPNYLLHVAGQAYIRNELLTAGAMMVAAGNNGIYVHDNGISVHNSSNVYTRTVMNFDLTNSNTTIYGSCTATSFINSSDKKLKTKVKTMTDEKAKDIIMSARPVTFEWNAKANELMGLEGEDIGLIAQEAEKYIPNAVKDAGNDHKGIDYTKFIAPLIKVVQEQQREIDELKKQLNNK